MPKDLRQNLEQLITHLQNMDFNNIEDRDEAEYQARLILSILDQQQDIEKIILGTIRYFKEMNCTRSEMNIITQLEWRIDKALKNKKIYEGE